mgnify:CR=1 FL=1
MASAKILEQKQQIVSDLAEKIKNAKSGVLVDYKGITVADDTKLRKSLREAGVEYAVTKNTLTSKAFDAVGYEKLKEVLSGMTALAVSEDPLAPAKILCDFAKNNESFEIKAGFIDGEQIDAEGVKALAAIPPKEVLIARMLGSMQSSLYGFAYALQAIIDKKNEGAEAPAEQAAE